MDEVSRVRNIKERFENINNNINQSTEPVNKNGQQLKNLQVIQQDTNIVKPQKCDRLEYSDKEVISSSRPNIKRKPAFRRDKIPTRSCNDFCIKPKSSMVSRRVRLFNNMDDVENLNDEKSIPIQTNTNCSELVSEMTGDFTQFYSKIKKSTKNSRNRQPALDFRNSTDHEGNSNDRKVTKTKLIDDSIGKMECNVNKENDFHSMKRQLPNDVNCELSDTLKRILKCPLPSGPPPQKPPRTFAVNSESLLQVEPKIQQPRRSKTESEIKLKKIENALVKHQKLIFTPNFTARKISLGSSSSIGVEKCAGIHKNKRRSSDRGSFSQLSCLSDFGCTVRPISDPYLSIPFTPSTLPIVQNNGDRHIYEDPTSLNSSRTSPSKNVEVYSLYYMSTPIDNIIDSPERKNVTEAQNLNVKANRVFGGHFTDEINVKSQNDISIDNKIKLWMNEAYSNKWTIISDGSSDSDSVFSASQEELTSDNKNKPASADQYNQLTLTRKGYCQRVASRVISRNQSVVQNVSDHKHLFECLLLIGLNLDAHNEKVPYIKMKYPTYVEVPQSIEHMCFPDAHEWYNRSSEKMVHEKLEEDRCYVIPLTNEAGLRKYAYCRRIKPEGESFALPLSYCILSGYKANEFYFSVLEQVENRHGQSDIEFSKFIQELYENKFPSKGQGLKIASSSEDGKNGGIKDEILMRPADTRLEDLRLAKTLAYLKINTFLLIFSSLLLERKVILLSNCISKLSTCIEGLQVALLPFEWQHTLITVVPSNVISVSDLCDAPTPYLIGLLKPKNNPTRVLSYLNNKIQVLVVDLDERKALRKVGDESSILPNHLAKGLKNALQLAHSSEIHTNNLLACEAFTRLFVEALGHYERYVISSGNDLHYAKSFQKEAFVRAGRSHQIRMFLEWFVETAAFSVFVDVRLQSSLLSRGLFEQRCKEYNEELIKSKHEKNNKLNKTVKQIGDLIKDWTT